MVYTVVSFEQYFTLIIAPHHASSVNIWPSHQSATLSNNLCGAGRISTLDECPHTLKKQPLFCICQFSSSVEVLSHMLGSQMANAACHISASSHPLL